MIKKIVKNISKISGSLHNMDDLIKKSGHNIILPFYHAVTDDCPIHIKNLYEPRSVESFKSDLDFLLEHFESISLKRLLEIKHNEEIPDKNYFHLTFDDGLSEFYHVVAPILKEKKIHATVFLNSDFIDNKKMFFRFKASILYEILKDESLLQLSFQEELKLDILAEKNGLDFSNYLIENKPYLSIEQIKELIVDGFTFGAHSKDHPLYKELHIKEQINQTQLSVEEVCSRLDLDYKVFSFPFTDDGVSKSFFETINNQTDLTFGCAGLKEDSAKNHLQRIPMETSKSGKDIIKEEYSYYLMKAKVGKNKIVRQ
jgi:peptidoglycan/xylan/chitin deacetylase (PgdA/CDA1 family)